MTRALAVATGITPRPLLRCRTWLILCAVLSGCSAVPDYDDHRAGDDHHTRGASAAISQPTIIGALGPLTERQSKALLARIDPNPNDLGMLQRHLAIELAVAESPLLAGNRTQLLRDGRATFQAMFAAISGAKKQINLEYFIVEDVESGGVRLGDLLVAQRQAGVAVNLIYDSYGSKNTPTAFFDRLAQAGVKIVEYNPINPLASHNGYRLNDRDHRKILVADGAIAIVGGVNLSSTYESIPSSSTSAQATPAVLWRDTDLQISGPAVAALQAQFLAHWREQNGPELVDGDFYPVLPPMGDSVIRIIGSTPDHEIPRYYVTLLSSIRNAEKRIYLSAAYFVPTHQAMEDLIHAAKRGVDVRLLLGDQSDSELALTVARSRYSDLLEVGVKIYETRGVMLHSKTVVIDGVWSVVGSSNFDHRSVLYNDEIDAVVLGSETAQQLEAMFADDLRGATQIDPATWDKRPVLEQLDGVFWRLWQSML
jgi:cardiolipin synthase